MIASGFPLAQPLRFTISWMTGTRLGVRWSGPVVPAVHGTGVHAVQAAVSGRDVTLPAVVVNVAAASAAWPRSTRFVTSDWDSLAANWIHAATMVDPRGTVTPVQRMPTVWSAASWISSRSLLESETLPVPGCSASSDDATVRASNAGRATGSCTLMLWVTGVDGNEPVSVTTSVTVYVPDVA